MNGSSPQNRVLPDSSAPATRSSFSRPVSEMPLMTSADYLRVLRPHLVINTSSGRSGAVIAVVVHLALILACLWLLRITLITTVSVLVSVVMGHSLACLAFFAHELSHGSLVKRHHLRGALELLLWGLNCFPATLWRRLHNENHHAETNTISDPDRPFRACESTPPRHYFNVLFMANNAGWRWRPTVLLTFTTYLIRNLASALGPTHWKAPLTVAKPRFRPCDRLSILLEVAVICLLQSGMLVFAWVSWWSILWVSVVPLMVSSAVVMMYIFTNHFLNPLCDHTDPLIGSTSVIVPKWMDWLHDNFSYHTEHHLFPGMNPRHYPEVARLLQQHFPERYNRILLGEAWQRLWAGSEFIEERETS